MDSIQVTSVEAIPSQVCQGEPVFIKVNLKNTGNAPASNKSIDVSVTPTGGSKPVKEIHVTSRYMEPGNADTSTDWFEYSMATGDLLGTFEVHVEKQSTTFMVKKCDQSSSAKTLQGSTEKTGNQTETGTKSVGLVPRWVKSIASWWSEGQISDKEFALALGYLVQTRIINVQPSVPPNSFVSLSDNMVIPQLVKDNTKSWAQGKTSDSSFLLTIQFMITNNIIRFEQPSNEGTTVTSDQQLSPETYEAAFVTNAWNEVTMSSLLEMKNYEAKVLDDASDQLWQDYSDNKDQTLMLKAEKVQKAAEVAKIDASKVVKVLGKTKSDSDMLKSKAKISGIQPTDLEKAAADPLAKFRQAKINSMNEFLDAKKRAHLASEQASIELKGVLGNLGYDQSKASSYNGMGSVIRYDDPYFLSTSSVISPETGGAISSSDGKLMIKFLPGSVKQDTNVLLKVLPQENFEAFGLKGTFRSGGETINYSDDAIYSQIKADLDARAELLKLALKQDVIDSYGNDVPKISTTPRKSSLAISF